VNDAKLVTDVDTPLHSGDVIRFGVDVDRGQEIFEAIEVRCEVEWVKPQCVVIPDDGVAIKPDPSPSTNSFSVPEDDSDIEPDFPSDDSSKESVAQSCETAVLQSADTSLISPVSSVQGDEHPKDEPKPHSECLAPIDESITKVVPGPTPLVPDIVSPLFDTNPLLDTKLSPAKPASTEIPSAQQEYDPNSLPAVCYQKVPEIHYSDWTMMRPMFMRLADMAWGESNIIPDVDHGRHIIHAARRCSLSKDAYWVDDSPSFQPCVGTEVYWEPDFEESDTSFHRMPGSLLRYWSVDKRRYWIIYEEEDGQHASNWWWIVEKPLELLSEELKCQLETETEVDDCHKCWIVRAWEPQMIGNRWCDVAPYWDPNFDKNWLADDESVDSDEEPQDSEGYMSESDGLGDSKSELYDEYPYLMFESESVHGADSELSVEDFDEDNDEEDDEEGLEEDHEVSDESENDSDCSSEGERLEHLLSQKPHIHPSLNSEYVKKLEKKLERTNHTDAVEVSKHVPEKAGPERLAQEVPVGQPLNPVRKESKPLMTQTAPGMTNPGARFPTHAVSSELPSSCQNKYPPMQRKIESTVGVPSFSHEFENCYHDGPFSTSAHVEDASVPYLATSRKSTLKRTATEMQSSSLEPSLSQDAQRLPVEPASQPDLNFDTASSEAKNAISSALAENVSAFADNEHPAKRIKSSHSTSKSLASHATTAVVSALLGGLGTIAMLAALPNNYFQ
jgi:hypothetical protein